jgi:uncharacterized protein (DUF1330 family)
MRKLTTAAIGAACSVLGAGATLHTHAATGPAFYAVYEAHVTDEDAYKKALPDAQKIIEEAGGVYIAGGFNKAKVDHGGPAVGNRYVIIRYENETAYDRFYKWRREGVDRQTRCRGSRDQSRGCRGEITGVWRRAGRSARRFTHRIGVADAEALRGSWTSQGGGKRRDPGITFRRSIIGRGVRSPKRRARPIQARTRRMA